MYNLWEEKREETFKIIIGSPSFPYMLILLLQLQKAITFCSWKPGLNQTELKTYFLQLG